MRIEIESVKKGKMTRIPEMSVDRERESELLVFWHIIYLSHRLKERRWCQPLWRGLDDRPWSRRGELPGPEGELLAVRAEPLRFRHSPAALHGRAWAIRVQWQSPSSWVEEGMWEGSSNRHDDSGGSSRKAKRRIHHRHSTRSRAYRICIAHRERTIVADKRRKKSREI